jgi:hypothetical protein
MALVRTTAAAAILATDTTITVASATGFSAGYWVRVNQEMMKVALNYVSGVSIPVVRGQDGTAVQAHPITTGVVVGTGADWTANGLQTPVQYPIAGRIRTTTSYGAAGAITFPIDGTDAVAVINGTSALAMTLAVPTVDLDGSILTIIGNGKAAHTVTIAGGIGAAGAGYTVATFITGSQQSLQLMACNGVWVQLPSLMSGTLTALLVAVA